MAIGVVAWASLGKGAGQDHHVRVHLAADTAVLAADAGIVTLSRPILDLDTLLIRRSAAGRGLARFTALTA